MSNADDIFGELAAARQDLNVALKALTSRAYGDAVDRIDLAIQGIDQATKLWAAERDYWALIEAEAAQVHRTRLTADGQYCSCGVKLDGDLTSAFLDHLEEVHS